MHVSVPCDSFSTSLGFEKFFEIIKAAGFTAYDLTCWKDGDPTQILELFDGEDYREVAARIRELADSAGLVCNQSHACFFGGDSELEEDSKEFAITVKNMEIASILGAKNIVIHPITSRWYANNEEQLYKDNLRFYRSLLPYAEKFNICILAENMYCYSVEHGNTIHGMFSTPEEFCRFIDEIDSPFLKACLDVGHAYLVVEDLYLFIKALGNERLLGLHVQDTSPNDDSHDLPYLHNVNFEDIINALRLIDYKGDITFECNGFALAFPEALQPSALKMMSDVGHYLKARLENKGE